MAPYTIIVEFNVDVPDLPAFLDLVTANARASLENELGCERFDVLIPKGETGHVTLYEIYRDEAAFKEHCCSAHFHVFDQAARSLVREKRVIELDLVTGVPADAALAVKAIVTPAG